MRAFAALALGVLFLAGCGGSDPPSDEDQVRTTISDYGKAVGGDEPERLCDLLVTPRGERPPEQCAARIARNRNQIRIGLPVGVRSVRVRGAAATATLENGERVRLRRVDDAWRIVTPG